MTVWAGTAVVFLVLAGLWAGVAWRSRRTGHVDNAVLAGLLAMACVLGALAFGIAAPGGG